MKTKIENMEWDEVIVYMGYNVEDEYQILMDFIHRGNGLEEEYYEFLRQRAIQELKSNQQAE